MNIKTLNIFFRNMTHCRIFFRLINGMRQVLCSEKFCLLTMTEAAAQRCSVKKVFHKFLMKTFVSGSLFSEAEACKNRLWHRCFTVNFVKLVRTPIFKNTSGDCFCNEICLWGSWNPSIKTKMVLFLTRAFLKVH